MGNKNSVLSSPHKSPETFARLLIPHIKNQTKPKGAAPSSSWASPRANSCFYIPMWAWGCKIANKCYFPMNPSLL